MKYAQVCQTLIDIDIYIESIFRATIVDKLMIIIEVDCNSGDNTQRVKWNCLK